MDRASQRKKPSGGLRAVPPPYFCFTVPRFHLLPAVEALLGLLFANLFWVGLWDLLDTTIFPFDSSLAMFALVVLGTVGMYFTNALYDPVPERAAPGAAAEPSYGATGGGGGSEATQTSAPGEQVVGRGAGGAGRAKMMVDELVASLDIQDQPCVAPRFEPWRLTERVLANCAAVFVWVGVWDQIDMNVLPVQCSYNACGRCFKYGQFPCAWYKILFIIVGLVGQYFTRGLYVDSEVSYAPRKNCPCCGGRMKKAAKDAAAASAPEAAT